MRNDEKTYKRLIHSERWLRLRRDILTAHPVCQGCGIAPASEVHHVIPCEHAVSEADMKSLMFDATNLRALCHPCHVQTHSEMGRTGKAAARRIHKAQAESAIEKLFGDAKGDEGGR